MKREIYYIVISIVWLFFGCISEDTSGCGDDGCCTGDCDNLVLLFSYPDYDREKDGRDVFSQRIANIDVFIYDSNFMFLQHIETSAEELEPTRSKSIRLEPGDYYLVSWANNTSGRQGIPQVYENTHLGENLIYHNHSTSADPLHYAPDQRNLFSQDVQQENKPLKITIPEKGTVAYTLTYMSAHRTLNIYLKGFGEITEDTENNPQINISGLTLHYNELLERSQELTQYNQTTNLIEKDHQPYGYSSFYLPHFDRQDEIEVLINWTQQDKSKQHTITMNQILQELKIEELFDGDHLLMEIIIENKGAYVEITQPGWGVIIVNPF